LKTQKKLIARVETRVMELHSYDTPEFVALEAQHVAPQYKKWIKSVSNVE
ncbi:MAG: divalent cation tolerance protein CutA, partial [Bdellovibrionales bacterium]|nr:divalent cation tolerance protein CutA [Bdellovibrionales bacterium]